MRKLLIAATALLISAGLASAEGDVKAGKKAFKKCKACHTVKAGKNKTGPTLFSILGQTAGQVDGFKYSDAMANSDIVWDEETLTAFLTKPKKFLPGTKMSFAGFKKPEDIENLLAYLASLEE